MPLKVLNGEHLPAQDLFIITQSYPDNSIKKQGQISTVLHGCKKAVVISENVGTIITVWMA